MSGDQTEGDAVLDNSITIEITKAQHKNNYMVKVGHVKLWICIFSKKYTK